jgi:hypothetical protein
MTDSEIIRLATLAKLGAQALPVVPTTLPPWLAQAKRWLFYDKSKKPLRIKDGKLRGGGQTEDEESTWMNFEQASAYAKKNGKLGLSIVLGQGVGGIDLDHVRDPAAGEWTSFARQCLNLAKSLGAYAEISPSGTGCKIFGQLGGTFYQGETCTIDEVIGDDTWQGKPVKIKAGYECWVRDRHFCVTGQSLFPYLQDPVDISPIQALIEARFPRAQGPGFLDLEAGDTIWFDPRELPPTKAGESIAEWFNRVDPAHHGAQILRDMGWTLHHTEPGKSHWTRPGKDPRAGHSATLFFDLGTFTVYSSAAPLAQGTYSLFRLYAQAYFQADGSAAALALRKWKELGKVHGIPTGPVIAPKPAQAPNPIQKAITQAIPEAGEKPGFSATRADKLLERYGQIAWVWKDWIASQVLHLITGEPGAGKTLVLNDILLAIHEGVALPDGTTAPKELTGKRVLYLDSDQRIHDTGTKLAKGFGIGSPIMDVVEFGTGATLRPIVSYDEKAGLFDWLAWQLKQGSHWCLVVDTIARFAGGAELNSPKEISKFIEPLQRIARDCNIPVFFVGHSNSQGDAYGRHIRGACQVSWLITKGSRQLKIDRAFAGDPEPLYFDFPPAGKEYSPLTWAKHKIAKSTSKASQELDEWILGRLAELDAVHEELAESQRNTGALITSATEAGIMPGGSEKSSKRRFYEALKRLQGAGKIWSTDHTGQSGGTYKRYRIGIDPNKGIAND